MTKRIALVAALILFASVASFAAPASAPWPWEASTSGGDPFDAVCRTENRAWCDRFECCTQHCLICSGSITDDGFEYVRVCEGICYPIAN